MAVIRISVICYTSYTSNIHDGMEKIFGQVYHTYCIFAEYIYEVYELCTGYIQ